MLLVCFCKSCSEVFLVTFPSSCLWSAMWPVVRHHSGWCPPCLTTHPFLISPHHHPQLHFLSRLFIFLPLPHLPACMLQLLQPHMFSASIMYLASVLQRSLHLHSSGLSPHSQHAATHTCPQTDFSASAFLSLQLPK